MLSINEFLAAVKRRGVEKVKSLLTQKIDVNAWDYSCKYASYYRKTALHIAVENGDKEIVKLLLKHRVKTEDGNVALRYAIINNHKEIMCLLLIYGATLDGDSESKVNDKFKECLIVLKEIKKMPNLGKLMEINKSTEENKVLFLDL